MLPHLNQQALLQTILEANAIEGQIGCLIHRVVKEGPVDLIETACRHYPAGLDMVDNEGWTPLLLAILLGKSAMAVRLLDCGADPNRAANRVTPLKMAIRMRRVEVVEKLFARRDNLQSEFPLHLAISLRDDEMAERLIRLGVDIHQPDRDGLTPLAWAAKMNFGVLVNLLLAEGAKITQLQREEDVAACIRLATAENFRRIFKQYSYYVVPGEYKITEDNFQLLARLVLLSDNLNHIIKMIEKGKQADCPVKIHSFLAEPKLVERLLEAGEGLYSHSEDEPLPLIAAILARQFDTARVLLSAGALIGARRATFAHRELRVVSAAHLITPLQWFANNLRRYVADNPKFKIWALCADLPQELLQPGIQEAFLLNDLYLQGLKDDPQIKIYGLRIQLMRYKARYPIIGTTSHHKNLKRVIDSALDTLNPGRDSLLLLSAFNTAMATRKDARLVAPEKVVDDVNWIDGGNRTFAFPLR